MPISVTRLIASSVVVLTLASGCGDDATTSTGADSSPTSTTHAPTDTATRILTGEITIRGADELSHLPEGASVVVRVEDITVQDASSVLLGEQVYDNIVTLPLAYEVSWTPPTNASADVSVSVSVHVDDELIFISDTVHTVTSGADAVDVDVISTTADGGLSGDVADIASSVIGLTEDEAVGSIEESGLMVRIAERNGEQFALTEDYRDNRINLVIVDDLVAETWIG